MVLNSCVPNSVSSANTSVAVPVNQMLDAVEFTEVEVHVCMS